MTVLKRLLAYRYAIALCCFVISVSLGLHGSSLANWSHFGVRENIDGTSSVAKQVSETELLTRWVTVPPAADGTLLGQPQMIRSDEWLVQTPFFLSQVETGLEVINPSYGLDGQQMILAYNAPVRHLSIIGKPFNWGFLFLDSGRGLSWYWSLKLIGLFLLAFEFAMVLTKRHAGLSLLGSVWITATPAIQWWFMQHLGDIVFFTLAIVVCLEHYFNREKIWQKALFAVGLLSSLIGFTLVIYPAFQVVFAYVILGFFFCRLIPHIRQGRLTRVDGVLITATVVVTLGILGQTLYQSREELTAILGTVYPGQRLSLGGEVGLERLGDFLLAVYLPFRVPHFLNQVELATAIHFLPLILLILPFLLKKAELKEHAFPIFLVGYSIWLYLYSFITFPAWFIKPLFFHYVSGGRAWQALSVIGVFISIWFLSYIWQKTIVPRTRVTLFGLALGTGIMLVLFAISREDYDVYIGTKALLLVGITWLVSFLAALMTKKILASSFLLTLVVLSGLTVNPLVKGIDFLMNKRLVSAIQKVVAQDREARWLTEGSLYNLPPMLGAKSLNSVRFYPDKTLMEQLDPGGHMENEWNRYSHMRVTLVPDGEGKMSNPYPDVLDLQLEFPNLNQLEVSYILSDRELSRFSELQLIYGPDQDGNRIYKYVE